MGIVAGCLFIVGAIVFAAGPENKGVSFDLVDEPASVGTVQDARI
jgi:hypothetical protein